MAKNRKPNLEYDYIQAHQLAGEGRLLRDTSLVPGANCPPSSDLLDFARGELDADRAQELEPHVNDCPHCRRCLNVYRDAATPDEPHHTGNTAIGATALAQSEMTWPVLRERLKPWMPSLLSLAGLSPTGADDFLNFMESKVPISKDEHVRDLLPGWLKEFGGPGVSLDALEDAHLTWMAIRVVAGRAVANESTTARQAREVLQTRSDVVTLEDIDRLTADGTLPPLPRSYWIEFNQEVRQEERGFRQTLAMAEAK